MSRSIMSMEIKLWNVHVRIGFPVANAFSYFAYEFTGTSRIIVNFHYLNQDGYDKVDVKRIDPRTDVKMCTEL